MREVSIEFINSMGIFNMSWQHLVMIAISCILMYLAIVKGFEPLLLIPISFGMLLTNLPLSGVMNEPVLSVLPHSGVMSEHGLEVIVHTTEPGGLLHYLFLGDELAIFPPLIFLGVGAMTDFGPVISNPKTFMLAAAAQLGIYFTFIGALLMGFTGSEAASIAIIGSADGPTSIFLVTKLAPHLLAPVVVAAYSYMALVPIIQPPIMKALTTPEERAIVMKQAKPVSKRIKIIFPIAVTIIVSLLLPTVATLIGMLMLGNLLKECAVADRLSEVAQNALMNIVIIFLGVSVGASAQAEIFLKVQTLQILSLGVVAFGVSTALGVIGAKLMNKVCKDKINPLIGGAAVSAMPMSARVAHKIGLEANPNNFLLMHAMGPTVSGTMASAIVAGIFISLFM